MQPDQMTRFGHSLIQHGPVNDRVYLMKLSDKDLPHVVGHLVELGRQRGYSKLFAKVCEHQAGPFAARGFTPEAQVPGMHQGRDTGYFMSRFLDEDRSRADDPVLLTDVLDLAQAKASDRPGQASADDEIQHLGPQHAHDLATLYADVFMSYPFPITDPNFIRQGMQTNVAFFGLWSGSRLMAAASAEMDRHWGCAEMTDFATRPEFRRQSAARRLLAHMEEHVSTLGISTAYTIARAQSPGMNIVFSSSGYGFGGTLCNNTHIGGQLESMNVWHKQINPR